MKKLVSLLLAISITAGASYTATAKTVVQNDQTVVANGHVINFKNTVLNVDDRDFNPLRELLNNLGVLDEDIHWDEATKTVTYSGYGKNVTFVIGEKYYIVDNIKHIVDVAPFLYKGNNYTYMPIRYAAESLGFTVEYDKETKTTGIIKPGVIIPETKIDVITDEKIVKNNKTFVYTKPVIAINGVVNFPIAETLVNLGSDINNITFDEATGVLSAKTSEGTIVFTFGSTNYTLDGKKSTITTAPYVYNGALYLPAKDIALAVNMTSEYNVANKTSTLLDPVPTTTPTPEITTVTGQKVMVDGNSVYYNYPVIKKDNIVYYQVKETLENIGIAKTDVKFDLTNGTLNAKTKIGNLIFTVGENTYYKDSEIKALSVKPILYNDNMYLPMKDIASAVEYGFSYRTDVDTINLNSDGITEPITTDVTDQKVAVNGNNVIFSSPIIKYEGNIYFPLAETLINLDTPDSSINYTKESGILIANAKIGYVTFTRGNQNCTINNSIVTLNSAPISHNGILYLPMKDIATVTGFTYAYDSSIMTNYLIKVVEPTPTATPTGTPAI